MTQSLEIKGFHTTSMHSLAISTRQAQGQFVYVPSWCDCSSCSQNVVHPLSKWCNYQEEADDDGSKLTTRLTSYGARCAGNDGRLRRCACAILVHFRRRRSVDRRRADDVVSPRPWRQRWRHHRRRLGAHVVAATVRLYDRLIPIRVVSRRRAVWIGYNSTRLLHSSVCPSIRPFYGRPFTVA